MEKHNCNYVEAMSHAGKEWKLLTDQAKEKYIKMAAIDKVRY